MTRKYWMSLMGMVAVLALTVGYLYSGVLSNPIGGDPVTVTVSLPRTGGLFEGSAVTVRGVKVGRVQRLQLSDSAIEATIRIDPGKRIPKDSPVKVRSLSPIGEQYLDFQPTSSDGPYLADGARVTATAADVPQSLADMAIAVDDLMKDLDASKLQGVLTELETALGGHQDDLRVLLNSGTSIVEKLDTAFPATKNLLVQGGQLMTVVAESGNEIFRAARSARTFATWLRSYQPELLRLLDQAPQQVTELRGLVQALGRDLPPLLGVTGDLGDLIAARDPHFRELFIRYADGIGTLAGAFRGKYVLIDFLFQRGPQCRYGSKERSPQDLSYRPVQGGGSCSRSLSFAQRGAQWVPPPR